MRAVIAAFGVLVVGSLSVHTQQTTQAPAFEVASVKPNTSGDTRATYAVPPTGQVSIVNAQLSQILVNAYQLDVAAARFTLIGGDESVMTARFDILAKPPEGAPAGQAREMLKTLLAERFKLRIHAETRQIPIYGLVVTREGRFGPAFGPNPASCLEFQASRARGMPLPNPTGIDGQQLCLVSPFGGPQGTVRQRSVGPLTMFIRSVQGFVDRPIVDATGLMGNFEWDVRYAISPDRPDAQAPSIYTALQEELGLRLEPRVGPQQVWVIDSVEMPTAN